MQNTAEVDQNRAAQSWMPSSVVDEVLLNDWHAVAYSGDVEEGKLLAIRLLGEELVAWRHEGTVHVWKDLCIHRGTRLSLGEVIDGTVVCPYHGWRYNCEGKCVLIPSQPDTPPPLKARAFTHRAEDRYGFVWVSLGEPERDVPPFPEFGNPEFRVVHSGPYPFRSSSFRAIENFIDASHFPFVHRDLNGERQKPDKINDYKVTKSIDGLATNAVRVFQPAGDHRMVPVNADYYYSVFRPNTAHISKFVTITDPAQAHLGADGENWCVFLAAQPVDEISSIIRIAVAHNFAHDLPEQDVIDRQDRVFEEDSEIVGSVRPERIPTDLKAQLSIRSDRLAVAYRSWLRELGVTYGTLDD